MIVQIVSCIRSQRSNSRDNLLCIIVKSLVPRDRTSILGCVIRRSDSNGSRILTRDRMVSHTAPHSLPKIFVHKNVTFRPSIRRVLKSHIAKEYNGSLFFNPVWDGFYFNNSEKKYYARRLYYLLSWFAAVSLLRLDCFVCCKGNLNFKVM